MTDDTRRRVTHEQIAKFEAASYEKKTGGLWRYHGKGPKYEIRRARDGSTPEWPAFVLAASDRAAPAALRAYSARARGMGMDATYCDDVLKLAEEFEAWRQQNGAGKPDALPDWIDEDIGALVAAEKDRKP